MKQVVAFGSDHVGFEMKGELIRRLKDRYEIMDAGPTAYDAYDDYPDYAYAAAVAVAEGKAWRGVLICGSGVGYASPPIRSWEYAPACAMIPFPRARVWNMSI